MKFRFQNWWVSTSVASRFGVGGVFFPVNCVLSVAAAKVKLLLHGFIVWLCNSEKFYSWQTLQGCGWAYLHNSFLRYLKQRSFSGL